MIRQIYRKMSELFPTRLLHNLPAFSSNGLISIILDGFIYVFLQFMSVRNSVVTSLILHFPFYILKVWYRICLNLQIFLLVIVMRLKNCQREATMFIGCIKHTVIFCKFFGRKLFKRHWWKNTNNCKPLFHTIARSGWTNKLPAYETVKKLNTNLIMI